MRTECAFKQTKVQRFVINIEQLLIILESVLSGKADEGWFEADFEHFFLFRRN